MILDVRAGGIPIGVLTHQATLQRWAFQYDAEWLKRADRYPLSPALPLQGNGDLTAEHHSIAVRLFFENLLPEGQALDDAVATYKLSRSNSIGLLAALGRETAGALEISQGDADRDLAERADAHKRLLTRAELSRRIRERPHLPFTVWDGRVRLAIAGYQDKLAVFEEAGEWYLVEGSTLASTHLLKPEPINELLAGMTTNEHFCMTLATAIGLDTASTRLEATPDPILLIERFDRGHLQNRVERLHCIDGCQALGLPVGLKYERPYGSSRDVKHIREGASLPALFAVIAEHSPFPVRDRVALLRWVIFQALIGNVDAHAKNVSFLVNASGLTLAPSYDLVCGLVYAGTEDTMALAIGDEFSPRELAAGDWARFAVNCHLPARLVAVELETVAKRSLDRLVEVGERVRTAGGAAAVIENVAEVVRTHAARARNAAPLVVEAARQS